MESEPEAVYTVFLMALNTILAASGSVQMGSLDDESFHAL